MDFWEVIRSRRAIRRYTDQAIPRELLESLLEAARWSPSAHNRQPWRFALVTTPQAQEDLARAMNQRLREDLSADEVSPEIIEKDVARSYARITGAQALICLCLSLEDMDRYPDAKRNEKEYVMAVQSTAMAGQNLLLAAHYSGLGACWMCAPLFCPDVVARVLQLPESWQAQALITLGYPAETKTRERQEIKVIWR